MERVIIFKVKCIFTWEWNDALSLSSLLGISYYEVVSCVGRIPWRRKWQPTPVFSPGQFHRQRNLVGYSPNGLQRVGHDWVTDHSRICLICPVLRFGNFCLFFSAWVCVCVCVCICICVSSSLCYLRLSFLAIYLLSPSFLSATQTSSSHPPVSPFAIVLSHLLHKDFRLAKTFAC